MFFAAAAAFLWLLTIHARKYPGFPDETIHHVFIAIDAVLIAALSKSANVLFR